MGLNWGSADLGWAWLLPDNWAQVYFQAVHFRAQAEGAATSWEKQSHDGIGCACKCFQPSAQSHWLTSHQPQQVTWLQPNSAAEKSTLPLCITRPGWVIMAKPYVCWTEENTPSSVVGLGRQCIPCNNNRIYQCATTIRGGGRQVCSAWLGWKEQRTHGPWEGWPCSLQVLLKGGGLLVITLG